MASGLAVYHCDILGSNELQQGTASKHYQCALVQADGQRHLELNANQGDGADLFGAAAGVVLSDTSTPHSRAWDGSDSGLVLSDVAGPGASIAFTVGSVATAQVVTGEDKPMVTIPDNTAGGVSSTIAIAATGSVARIKVVVDITHTYIGDLRVTLVAPNGRTAVLHARLGGSSDDLKATYDAASPGVLTSMVGVPMQGQWTLQVVDLAARDVGVLQRWELELAG